MNNDKRCKEFGIWIFVGFVGKSLEYDGGKLELVRIINFFFRFELFVGVYFGIFEIL